MLTRVFKSGNSLAVRIPKELAIVEASQEVEIERVGQSLVIRPVVRETLADLPAIFASFSDGMRSWQREPTEQKERDWSGWWDAAQPAPLEALAVHDPGADPAHRSEVTERATVHRPTGEMAAGSEVKATTEPAELAPASQAAPSRTRRQTSSRAKGA